MVHPVRILLLAVCLVGALARPHAGQLKLVGGIVPSTIGVPEDGRTRVPARVEQPDQGDGAGAALRFSPEVTLCPEDVGQDLSRSWRGRLERETPWMDTSRGRRTSAPRAPPAC